MIDDTPLPNEAELTQPEPDVQSVENKVSEMDPFFSTGHFSMHHQPGHDDDETFIGE